MKIGLVQTRTPTSHAAALAHIEPLVREAAAGGARLVATPEGSNILEKDKARLFPQLKALAEDPVVLGLQRLAQELDVWILCGSALVLRDDGKAANRQALIAPDGRIIATYDKLHMFDVDLPNGETARESATYEPGERAVLSAVDGVHLGHAICYDVRFPALFRALAVAGAQVLAIPAAFTRPTGEAHWEVLLRARAIETGSYVIAPAQGGFHEDGRGTWGRSLVVGPWGEVLGKLDHDEPGVLLADIEPEAVAKARAAIPALANARAFTGP
jgi:Predicted amidohydrolase